MRQCHATGISCRSKLDEINPNNPTAPRHTTEKIKHLPVGKSTWCWRIDTRHNRRIDPVRIDRDVIAFRHWEALQNPRDAPLVDNTGRNKDASPGPSCRKLLSTPTPSTAQSHLEHGTHRWEFARSAHWTRVPFPNTIDFIAPVKMRINLNDTERAKAAVGAQYRYRDCVVTSENNWDCSTVEQIGDCTSDPRKIPRMVTGEKHDIPGIGQRKCPVGKEITVEINVVVPVIRLKSQRCRTERRWCGCRGELWTTARVGHAVRYTEKGDVGRLLQLVEAGKSENSGTTGLNRENRHLGAAYLVLLLHRHRRATFHFSSIVTRAQPLVKPISVYSAHPKDWRTQRRRRIRVGRGGETMESREKAVQLVRERTRFSAERPSWVRPSYEGFGIVNLPWSILTTLGALPAGTPVSDDLWPSHLTQGVEAVLLIIIDGLGYERLAQAMADGEVPGLARLAEEGVLFPLTSVLPSTTVAALTALATGEPPARHGLIGFTAFLREFGMLSNLLFWSPLGRFPSYANAGLEPRQFLPVPTIAERAASVGIRSTVVSPEAFRDTPLTKMQTAGAEFRGYRTAGEFVAHAHTALAQPGRQLVTLYWDSLDTLGHFAGPESAAWHIELRQLDRLIAEELIARLPRRDVLVVLTADHGMVPLDPTRQRPLSDPTLLAHLALPPAGERRAVYLHPLPGRAADVLERVRQLAADDGVILAGSELFEEGLFGPPPHHPEAQYRVGELVLLAVGAASFPWDPPGAHLRPFFGAHASLESAEQLVPCLLWRP